MCSSEKGFYQKIFKKSQNIMLLYTQFLNLIANYWIKVQLFYMSFSCSRLFSAINFFFEGDRYFDLLTINEEKNMFRYDKSSLNIEYLEQNIKYKTQNLPPKLSTTQLICNQSVSQVLSAAVQQYLPNCWPSLNFPIVSK